MAEIAASSQQPTTQQPTPTAAAPGEDAKIGSQYIYSIQYRE
jgi:hypothetical protein